MLAAVGLAVSAHAADSAPMRKRAVARVATEVAGYLGNTPAVARGSYIDPRIMSAYERGASIIAELDKLGRDAEYGDLATRGPIEDAVRRLLRTTREA